MRAPIYNSTSEANKHTLVLEVVRHYNEQLRELAHETYGINKDSTIFSVAFTAALSLKPHEVFRKVGILQ